MSEDGFDDEYLVGSKVHTSRILLRAWFSHLQLHSLSHLKTAVGSGTPVWGLIVLLVAEQ